MQKLSFRMGLLCTLLVVLAGVCSAQAEEIAAIQPPRINSEPPVTHMPEVHVVGYETDVAQRLLRVIPAIPLPPFSSLRKFLHEHHVAMHCLLEWRDDSGQWWYAELRSVWHKSKCFTVGGGGFPGSGFSVYGIYICPGRLERDFDEKGKPMKVLMDEIVACDYRAMEAEIRKYGANDKRPGQPGTGGLGEVNVGLGGPAYKPSQNSNTMVHYILSRCGVELPTPPLAVGWDTVPQFPYSTDADTVPMDSIP